MLPAVIAKLPAEPKQSLLERGKVKKQDSQRGAHRNPSGFDLFLSVFPLPLVQRFPQN